MPKDNITERVGHYLKENGVLLKKYKLIARLIINFPRRRKPTLLSRLLLWIVAKQGGILDTQFNDKK